MSTQVTTPGSTTRLHATEVVDPHIDIRPGSLPVGAPVEVRNRFDDRWTHGFSVAVIGDESYQLRRLSDGSVLPAWFPAAMIRADLSA